jgi:hypothetical protein
VAPPSGGASATSGLTLRQLLLPRLVAHRDPDLLLSKPGVGKGWDPALGSSLVAEQGDDRLASAAWGLTSVSFLPGAIAQTPCGVWDYRAVVVELSTLEFTVSPLAVTG